MPRSTWSSRIKLGLTWFSWAFLVLNEIPNLAYTPYLHFKTVVTSCLSKRRRRKEEKGKKNISWCLMHSCQFCSVLKLGWGRTETPFKLFFPNSSGFDQFWPEQPKSINSSLNWQKSTTPPLPILLLPLHKWGNGPFASLTPDLLVNGLLENSYIKGVEPTLVENPSRV